MPSEAGDDLKANDQDYWEGLLGEERPATPPCLFNDDDRLPALDRYNREFPEDFFDQDLPDNEDDPGEPENEPNDDALPAFQGFFRDLDAEEEDPPPNGHPCVAFDNEPKDFRNIMIRVYLLSAFSGVTNESIAEILTTHKMEFQMLEARGQLSEELRLRLPFFPKTLRTLQNRLGMNINELFSIFALCPLCGTRYSMDHINRSDHPACTYSIAGKECREPIYRETRLYGGTRKRIPFKSFPYLPLARSLERNLDLWDGWGWRNQLVGLDRQYDEETGRYGDLPTEELRLLVWLPFGLSLSINIDGFQVHKRGKYSVQGVYIVINNLPLQLRTHPENMILVTVMPGPKEPTSYEYNQMLQPMVDDLIALGKGMNLWVHNKELNRCEKRLVHAAISNQIVDYMSCVKTSGHAGTSSHLHFCLYCKTKRYYLSVQEGFQREGLVLRNHQEYLQHKHDWLVAAEEDKEPMRELNGTRFVEMDRLPESPEGLLDAALEDLYLPSSCARILKSLDKITSRTKAEQWKNITSVLHILLFKAWKVGDTIPDSDIPQGRKGSKHRNDQERQAALLLTERLLVHID
ncbi:hypothetical protein BDV93DRAFT_512771 [Ceratobasidium sp. AG-I]|nr:hypothetical protein BDV93DRAFT_512771 [Ceratobasidium sp. AG-I]